MKEDRGTTGKDAAQSQGANDVERYLALLSAEDEGDVAGTMPKVSEPDDDIDAGTEAVFARCDAALALTPRLTESPALAWAFAEARQIARSTPADPALPWHRRVAVAWSAAALSAAFALILAVLVLAPPERNAAPRSPVFGAPEISFTPIVVPQEMANEVAAIDPVALLADTVPVDSRSIVVLPFVGVAASPGGTSGAIEATADSLYGQLVRQLAAIPGIYVIDPGTAAVYADVELQPEQIALYLGVRGVVQGRVDSDGDTISLDLLFTDAAGTGHSIDRAFERPVAEVAMLQKDVALSVLDALIDHRTTDPTLN